MPKRLYRLAHMKRLIFSTVKGSLLLAVGMLAGVYGPHKLNSYVDEYWVEAAHQALITSMVDARNYAWDNGVSVELCLATAEQQCVEPSQNNVAGWLTYEVANNGTKTPVNFYRFHAQHVGVIGSNRYVLRTPLGFDDEGYSLQPGVIGFEVYSLSGVSAKNYTVLIEPSGALQTLVNSTLQASVKTAQSRWLAVLTDT